MRVECLIYLKIKKLKDTRLITVRPSNPYNTRPLGGGVGLSLDPAGRLKVMVSI